MTDDNGILARIPGSDIASAVRSLPAAQTSTAEVAETVIEVPGFGAVRFTAKRLVSKKGKSRTYFWSVTRAEKV